MSKSRRDFFRKAFTGAGLLTGATALASSPRGLHNALRSKPEPKSSWIPVRTPDVPDLPFTWDNGVKVFHLVAEPVKRQITPTKTLDLWGYNGTSPGPTIQVTQGDRVRIIFDNHLPEPTSMHWHGFEIPNDMDGAPGISQDPVLPGGRFIYEFTLHQEGTYFYHSHMAMQEMIGMLGAFIMHPRTPYEPRADKDFVLLLQEYAVLPNNVHGHTFYVTGTEAGRAPESTWRPENTVLVGVAQARDIEFIANNPGDWMLHCHLPHHMMNQMSSTIGPMTRLGKGMPAGAAMEEGMGMLTGTPGAPMGEDYGPSLGRGMGVGSTLDHTAGHAPLLPSKAISQAASPGATEMQHGHAHSIPGTGATALISPNANSIPGFPQDAYMEGPMMNIDRLVQKPENYGLRPGWSSYMQGMMTLVRVLPPDLYDKILALQERT